LFFTTQFFPLFLLVKDEMAELLIVFEASRKYLQVMV
jgi:hypothetical protein